MSRPTYLTIDLQALQHNFMKVQRFAPRQAIIAMVKANAYGHGIVQVAKALTKADAFGVASLDEGIKLREAGIEQPIVLMEGLFNRDEVEEAANRHFTLVIHHDPHIDMLEKIKPHQTFPVWLKVNTGMHRLGMEPSEVHKAYQRLMSLKSIQKPIGFMTHFAEADAVDPVRTREQLQLFEETICAFKGPRSLANSAAILTHSASHADWIRPGLMLYGASPLKDKIGKDHYLKPVMTLSSELIAINQVKKGRRVGYGGTFSANEDMLVGIVGVGYGDGYPQHADNGTPALVRGKICPLVGRVSMDMLAVDLRHLPDAALGDPVILWGEGLPVEWVAKGSHTTPYEILTRMTPRPKLRLKNS